MLHELISKRCFYDQGVKWVLDEMRAALIRAVRPAHLYVLILQVPTIVVLLLTSSSAISSAERNYEIFYSLSTYTISLTIHFRVTLTLHEKPSFLLLLLRTALPGKLITLVQPSWTTLAEANQFVW